MNSAASAGMRAVPSVDSLLRSPEGNALAQRFGRNSLAEAVRVELADLRGLMARADGAESVARRPGEILAMVQSRLEKADVPNLRPVVNATGVILHTGLGRAAMPDCARAAVRDLAGYCNVQMDVELGERIDREVCVRELVRELTGAEDVAVVNNNAGATLLVLSALARGREVVVSRGELIEIGGSFRLPDIMSESGAILREVGTTNKTHLRDYARAIGPNTALLLKVHKSNYEIVGFAHEVGIADIVKEGKGRGIPAVDDLGCGAMTDLRQFGLPHEMTVRESLEAGADLVLFSTDKLIGGPQGGMIVGRRELVHKVRSHPLYRALRVCKMTLAALERTLRLFRDPDDLIRTHPVYEMLARNPADLERNARAMAEEITRARPDWKTDVTADDSYLGGGSVPGASLPSYAVALASPSHSADLLSRSLRGGPVPVIPRIRENAVLLNLRTISADDVYHVLGACRGV